MRKKWIVALMLSGAIAMSSFGGLVACGDDREPITPGVTVPGDTDDDNKPGDEEEKHTKPTITVTPKEIEIYAGDEIDLMLGVSAVDEDGNSVNVTISDDDDFDVDSPAEGEYTITYKATAYGLDAYETRTIVVLAELAPIVIQTRTAWGKGDVWQSTDKITFRNREYHELTANAEFERMSGVFHNKSENAIVVSVASGGGCVAIIDKNGMLVEGRDGANGRLVNADNPLRANSSVSSFEYNGETISVSTQFATAMTIPAGGFAIVLQNSHFGTGSADADGRSFFNYNIIHEYGNVVRLYWDDPDATSIEYITPYVNQAPTVTGNTDIFVLPNQEGFDLAAAVKAGLTVKDDNGTFDIDDDITLDAESVTVTDVGDFDIATEGDYIVTLSATDGNRATTFTRKVKVVGEEYITTVSIEGTTFAPIVMLNTSVAKNQELTGVGSYAFIVYDYGYKQAHETLDYTNGYGEAYIVNKFGKIVRTYDGANGTYSDATGTNKSGVIGPTNYLESAYASLGEDEILFIAPNGGTNNTANTGSRWLLMQLASRTAIGKTFNFTGYDWSNVEYENQPPIVSGATDIIVLPNQAGFVLLDAVRAGLTIKDDNGTFDSSDDITLDVECVTIKDDGGFDIAGGGDYLITLEAVDADGAKTVFTRKIKVASASEITVITIGTDSSAVSLTMLNNMIVKNTAVDNSKVANYWVVVYDYDYKTANPTAMGFNANKFGVAFVVNRYGKIVRVYNGITNKVHSATAPAGESGIISGNAYAAAAYESLQSGETLFIAPNSTGNTNDNNHSRGLFNNTSSKIGEMFNFTGFTWEEEPEITTVNVKFGNDSLTVNEAEYSYNASATGAKLEVFKSPETAPVLTDYDKGVAVIVNKFGEIVKVYDGVNNKLYDGTSADGVALDVSTTKYAAQAYAALADGDMLVVFKGESGEHITYAVALSGAIEQTVELPAVTFEARGITLSVNGKTFFVRGNRYIENQTPSSVANYQILAYDYGYSGSVGEGWSYGVAMVIDADGKLVRVYDGANGGSPVYDETGKLATLPEGMSNSTYAKCAFENLNEGETLLVFVNNSAIDSNAARAFALGCRLDGSIGKTLTLTDTRKQAAD